MTRYLGDLNGTTRHSAAGSVAHSRHGSEGLRAAGGVVESAGGDPEIPGWSLHETGTCRMGNDPKNFVTNRFGQTHDVLNLYVRRRQRVSELHRQDHDHQHSGVFVAHVRTSDREFRQGEHKAA